MTHGVWKSVWIVSVIDRLLKLFDEVGSKRFLHTQSHIHVYSA